MAPFLFYSIMTTVMCSVMAAVALAVSSEAVRLRCPHAKYIRILALVGVLVWPLMPVAFGWMVMSIPLDARPLDDDDQAEM